ncbi:hypothetical protein [Halorubrum sp. DTA98]|uniref:hypothetical protein n=1 Tax=Halorubrum sp. DTA98 TaxID=3402163 RepID=UPI003AAF7003
MKSPHEDVISTQFKRYIEENDTDKLDPEEQIFIGEMPEGPEGGSLLFNTDTIWVQVPPYAQLLPPKSSFSFIRGGNVGNIQGRMPVHELEVDDFRRLPLFLSDAVLSSNQILVPGDHYLYWGWTGAFFRYLTAKHPWGHRMFHTAGSSAGRGNIPVKSSVSRPSRNAPYVWGEEYRPVLRDFFTLLHNMLLPVREGEYSMELKKRFYHLNPSFLGVQRDFGLKYATSVGFSVLEGLVRRRCDALNDDGTVKKGYGSHQFPSGNKLNNVRSATLFQALDLWKSQNNTLPIVKQTLKEIDDLTQTKYSYSKLANKFRGLDEKELKKFDSFFWALYKQRSSNIHGEDSTMAMGAVVVTLCCLALWDELSENDINFDLDQDSITKSRWPDPAKYSTEKKKCIEWIKESQQSIETGYWQIPTDSSGLPVDQMTPRNFYPVQRTFYQIEDAVEW